MIINFLYRLLSGFITIDVSAAHEDSMTKSESSFRKDVIDRLDRIEKRLLDPDTGLVVECNENTRFRKSFWKVMNWVIAAFVTETIAFVYFLAKKGI
jgi:hypothetical protein